MNQHHAHWSPFTANKAFNVNPRMLKTAKGMYWTDRDNRRILDMAAGLWCTNLGHGRKRVADAIYQSALELDYAPSFGFGHASSFKLAERLTQLMPGELNHVFFTCSGSESVDTAFKLAAAYHHARGETQRKIIISRERAYHGVNLGGTSAGGIETNTQAFGRWGRVSHLDDVHDLKNSAFSRGLPDHGADKAEQLAQLIQQHGAQHIAAVIAEPIQGAGGLILPPKGYLKRLRELCTEYQIPLIFDEVVCAFGRTGSFTAAQEFNVLPDIMTTAKGLTSGTVPMGAVFCSSEVYQTIMDATPEGIEFAHGYTYSAHPLACAAANACLDIYLEEDLFSRASGGIATCLENALHEFRSNSHVVDIRNYGLLGAVQFDDPSGSSMPGVAVFQSAWENGLMVRGLKDTVIVSPPLIIEEKHINEFYDALDRSIREALG